MKLRFLGKDSTPTNSPTLYASDQETYVVQGWIVTDPALLDRLDLPDDETVVEVPPGLMRSLAADGLTGDVGVPAAPIVHVTHAGTYIVRGRRVHDSEALAHMTIPDHETCVEVSKSVMATLLVGG
jgi:hypothetical protein